LAAAGCALVADLEPALAFAAMAHVAAIKVPRMISPKIFFTYSLSLVLMSEAGQIIHFVLEKSTFRLPQLQ
jgi:hypothetical protein